MKKQKHIRLIKIGYLIAVGVALFATVSPYSSFVSGNIFLPLGIIDWPTPLYILALGLFGSLPPLLALLGGVLVKRLYPAETVDSAIAQLESLDKAQKALSESLSFLDTLRKAIQEGEARQKELEQLVDSLQVTSKESAEELRKKLAAIEYVHRSREYIRIAIGFALGIVASLIASAIWSLANLR